MTCKEKRSKKAILYEKYKGQCFFCGEKLLLENMTVDHFIPQKLGGGDEIENLRPSCRKCNADKGHLDTKWFLRKTDLMIQEQTEELKRLKRLSKTLTEIITWS